MIRAAAAGLAFCLLAAGCAKPAAATYTITIADMAYGAVPAHLRVGDTVEWVNADILQHTATARDGAFDLDLPPKARARSVLTRTGTVEVYCRYHPGMTARLPVAG